MRSDLLALCDALAARADERRRCGAAAGKYTEAHARLVSALRYLDAGDLIFDGFVAKMDAKAAESGRVFDRDKLALVFRKPRTAPRPKVEPEPKPKKAPAAKKAAPKAKKKAKK